MKVKKRMKNRPLTATMKKKNYFNDTDKSLNLEKEKKNFYYSYQNIFYKTNENWNEKHEELIHLWNDLGVTKQFQEQFKHLIKNLTDKEREIHIYHEKKKLERFRNVLLKLSKEIMERKKNIEILKKYDEILENSDSNKDENFNSILNDLVNLLKKIRLNGINCVKYLMKFREVSSYSINLGKHNLKNLNSAYYYDDNYLITMKSDLHFLMNTNIKKYIFFSNDDIDPFLICCSIKENKQSNKIIIPIENNIIYDIKHAKYSLIQESLLENIQNDNNFSLSNVPSYTNNLNSFKKNYSNKKINETNSLFFISRETNLDFSNKSFNIGNNSKRNLILHKEKNQIKNIKRKLDIKRNKNSLFFPFKEESFNKNTFINKNDKVNIYRNQTYNINSNKNYKLRQQLMTRDEFIKKLNKIGEENKKGEIIDLFRKKKEEEEIKEKINFEEVQKLKKKLEEKEKKIKKLEEEERKRKKEEEKRKKKEKEKEINSDEDI